SAGSATLTTKQSSAASSSASMIFRPPSLLSSTPGMRAPNPSSGLQPCSPSRKNSPGVAERSSRSSPAAPARNPENGGKRLYSYFADTTLAIITADPQARYFRRRPRRAATVLAMVLPVLAPIVAWAVGSEICRHDTRISVLVANFEADPQLAHYRVTRTVFEHLRDAVKEFPDVELELLGKSVPWNKNPNSILSWCQKQRNVMLIWGDFDTTREVVVVSAHFRLLNAALPLQAWNDQRSPLGEVEDFTVQDSLSHEFAYLTLLAVGITRFENTDYHSAIKQLTA